MARLLGDRQRAAEKQRAADAGAPAGSARVTQNARADTKAAFAAVGELAYMRNAA